MSTGVALSRSVTYVHSETDFVKVYQIRRVSEAPGGAQDNMYSNFPTA